MSTVKQINQKSDEQAIVKLNSLGLSTSYIATELSIHPSTVTNRLNKLNIPQTDTRRSFMEDIYKSLSSDQQDWLASQLGPHLSVKDFMKNLLVERYIREHTTSNS